MTTPGYDDDVRQSYLYWSSVEDYESCPRKYLWGHGHGDIDLGRGPGRSKEKPIKDSKHHAVMGNVLSKAIEHLYNDELWRTPSTLSERLVDIVRQELDSCLKDPKTYIDWGKSPPKEELERICTTGILGYLRTMKDNKLLGPYAKSEVDLTTWIDQYTPVAGRPDLIVRRDDSGVTILDGKNSLSPGKYTDPDQLRWYAMCFYLSYRTLPNRLVFCYFRYPAGNPPPGHPEGEPWTGLVDVPFTVEDLKSIRHRGKETYRSIQDQMFDPTPSPKTCKFCEYESVCDARQEQKAQNARKRKTSGPEDDLVGQGGVMELGFVPQAALTRKKS